MLVRPTVEAYFQETTTTNVDNDTPTKQRFCIHRRSAPISKPLPGTYVSYVEDHQEDCRFFKPNVIYLPRTMNFILKPLLHNEEIFNLHRQVLKEALLEVIKSENDEALSSSSILQTLCVESVAKQEVSRVLDAGSHNNTRVPLTRRSNHKFNRIMSTWRKLRFKRVRNEHYLPNKFIADVQRSKLELKFVIKQLKIDNP
jgi:hypothetical protein